MELPSAVFQRCKLHRTAIIVTLRGKDIPAGYLFETREANHVNTSVRQCDEKFCWDNFGRSANIVTYAPSSM